MAQVECQPVCSPQVYSIATDIQCELCPCHRERPATHYISHDHPGRVKPGRQCSAFVCDSCLALYLDGWLDEPQDPVWEEENRG